MNIFINKPNGISIQTEVHKDWTIGQLKNILENNLFIPKHVQCLSFGTNVLNDFDYIEDLGITNGYIINLNYELLGGGAKDSSRFKKSTSCFRWKWKKKRTRRLQKKRRKMRMRAR